MEKLTEQTLRRWMAIYNQIPGEIERLKSCVRQLEIMKNDFIDISTSNMGGGSKGNIISDPTFRAVIKLEETYDKNVARVTNEIDELREIYDNVNRIMTRIKVEDVTKQRIEFKVIKLNCVDGLHMTKVCHQVNCDRSTAFRIRKRIIENMVKYWNT